MCVIKQWISTQRKKNTCTKCIDNYIFFFIYSIPENIFMLSLLFITLLLITSFCVCVLNIIYIFFFICFSYIDNLDFRILMTGYFQVFMRLITFKCFQWTLCFLKLIDFQYHLLYINLHQENNKMINIKGYHGIHPCLNVIYLEI